MNDLSVYYPAIPKSLLTNPLDATVQDFSRARILMNHLSPKSKLSYKLNEHNMAIIPGGLRFHQVPFNQEQTGDLQIVEFQHERFSVMTYSYCSKNEFHNPHAMFMGVPLSELNETIQNACKSINR